MAGQTAPSLFLSFLSLYLLSVTGFVGNSPRRISSFRGRFERGVISFVRASKPRQRECGWGDLKLSLLRQEIVAAWTRSCC
jgi:hypothetical protein